MPAAKGSARTLLGPMSVSMWARGPGTSHRFSLVANWDQGVERFCIIQDRDKTKFINKLFEEEKFNKTK